MGEEQNDDQAWEQIMNDANSKEFRRRLLKDFILGGVALLCLYGFMNYPFSSVVIGGVMILILLAWLSETKSLRQKERWPPTGRPVVITGCDTGFGNRLAKHLDQFGATVFAGCLNANSSGALKLKDECSSRLHVLQMDVTDEAQVAECVDYVFKATDGAGIWGLVNNAGLNFLGDVELTTMAQFAKVADINQLGMVRVTKAFLPQIRRRQGRIVNVTSVKGKIAEPFNAAYVMTKYATEAFSDILRMEMKKFGVSVAILEPGNFGGATECLNMDRISGDFEQMWTSLTEEQRETYGREYIDHHIAATDRFRLTACFNLLPVIEAMVDALFSVAPQTRYLVPGGSGWYDIYRWRILVQPFLPTWLMDRWLLRNIRTFPSPHLASSDM